mmetsp:Transcript_18252/g.51524  ORF Transcript_18252/g.51524 Transcript_18252/m.51524 type:complete len:130 (-) Transcript_18252:19-408(-)
MDHREDVQKQIMTLLEGYRELLASCQVSTDEKGVDEENTIIECEKNDFRLSVASANLITAIENIFALNHELEKVALTNDIQARDDVRKQKTQTMELKEKEIESNIQSLREEMTDSLAKLERSYYTSNYK